MPTCLDKDPEQTGTVRGCFCPENQFLQDGECVAADGCKCLYEGQFYDVSQTKGPQVISFSNTVQYVLKYTSLLRHRLSQGHSG